MSRTRQTQFHHQISNNTDPALPVIAVSQDRPANFDIPAHSHLRAQLIYATDGVMRVSTGSATWVVPPQQAVWIPSQIEHSTVSLGPLAFRTLYIHPGVAAELPDVCCVLTIPPLLRELILHAVTLPQIYEPGGADARIMAVIPDLLRTLKPEPLQLPLPDDKRVRIITDALMQDPADKQSLADWANHVGASERTLSRHFRSETGISFNEWRQRLRLLWSISMLSEDRPVSAVAYELGYESPSAFIAMFRREMGLSPRRYMQERLGSERETNL
jgi:AraC-like DNA-binding protein/quercetin dioxygenase-like cupin family protein